MSLGTDGRVEIENDGVLNGPVPPDCACDVETAVLACTRSSVAGLTALMGPGDDSVEVLFDLPARLEGREGADALTSAAAGDALFGGPGADVLESVREQTASTGGDDADRLDGGEGSGLAREGSGAGTAGGEDPAAR